MRGLEEPGIKFDKEVEIILMKCFLNIIDTVKRKKPDVIITCHGGATERPRDVAYLLEKVKGLDGYVRG